MDWGSQRPGRCSDAGCPLHVATLGLSELVNFAGPTLTAPGDPAPPQTAAGPAAVVHRGFAEGPVFHFAAQTGSSGPVAGSGSPWPAPESFREAQKQHPGAASDHTIP